MVLELGSIYGFFCFLNLFSVVKAIKERTLIVVKKYILKLWVDAFVLKS